ncbi:MAG TPA: hypothetical protein VIL38_08810 [Thermaerobacter sp.]
MTQNGTVWWYGIGLRPGDIERLARHPGWEPAGLARTVDAVPDPREPVDVWLVQAPDLAEALRCGRLVRNRNREGVLWLLAPAGAATEVWEAAAAALLGGAPAVRVATSLDQVLDEPDPKSKRAGGEDGPMRPEAPASPGDAAKRVAGFKRPPLDGPPQVVEPDGLAQAAGSHAGTAPPPPQGNPRAGAGPGGGDPANRPSLPARVSPSGGPSSPAGSGPLASFDAAASPGAGARLLVVTGVKGGTGRTWLACELAVAAAIRGLRTGLVDAHWTAADVGVVLDLGPGPTILDLQPLLDGPEEAWTEQWLVHLRSGLRVLAAPPRPDLAELVAPDALQRVLKRALHLFDVVVVDGPAEPAQPVLPTLPHPRRWDLVVTTPDGPALRRTRLWLEQFAADGGLDAGLRVVVNRWSGPDAARQEIQRYLGRPVAAWIPDDAGAVAQASASGLPLVLAQPGHPAVQAVGGLLAAALGQPAEGPRGGPLSRLWRRWRSGAGGIRPAGPVEGVTFRAG